MTTDRLAVEIEFAGLAHPFEFEENLAIGGAGGQLEMFPIPGDSGGKVGDVFFESFVLVPGVRQGDRSPFAVVKRRFFRALCIP